MTVPRKFNCPVTETPCLESGCTVGRCLRRTRDEAAQREKATRDERRRRETAQLTPEELAKLLEEL
jgi:hypothetical protein